MKTYRSPKIKVRSNTLSGQGVVAIEDIEQDEIVAIKSGHIVTRERLKRISDEVGDFALQIDDDFYLTPTSPDEVDDMSVFINHSCDPNVGFLGTGRGEAAAILAIATATAEGLSRVAKSLNEKGGESAMQLRVAEDYLEQFGNIAKQGNTLVVPANLADISSMIALATNIIKKDSNSSPA